MSAVRSVTPFHRSPPPAEPLGDIIAAGIQGLAEDIIERIRMNRRSSMASYVLADEQGHVYVLRESAEAEADAHADWIVGCYCDTPRAEQIREDLLAHYQVAGLKRRRLALRS